MLDEFLIFLPFIIGKTYTVPVFIRELVDVGAQAKIADCGNALEFFPEILAGDRACLGLLLQLQLDLTPKKLLEVSLLLITDSDLISTESKLEVKIK